MECGEYSRRDNRHVPPRFLVPGTYATGDRIDLPADEAQHLTRVLRLRAGDAVRVFDGHGREFDAIVGGVTKGTASVEVGQPWEPSPEPRLPVTIAHAVLKGDKMDDVVRDAVMMGAAAIQPIVTTRAEVTIAALARGHRLDRWTRIAASSAKQCGRAVVPPVHEPISFDALSDGLRKLTLPQPALMLVEPSVDVTAVPLVELGPTPPREATLVIGPEGGWAPEEIDKGAAVCRLVRLGGRTLRADAMALVAMAALFTLWGEY
jgi:16S rRNA (uracil1498-N3)-methyltransferase